MPSYSPQTWIDGASGGTPVSAARLNNMEAGIAAAVATVDLPESVQDIVGAMLVSGGNLTLAYNDNTGKVTLTGTGADAEVVRDTIGAALIGTQGVTIGINDAADTITLGITGLTIAQIGGLQTALDSLKSDKVSTVSPAGSAQTLPSQDTATVHDLTLSAATCAITLPAAATAGIARGITVLLRQDATGGRAVTWAAPSGSSLVWLGGSAPTIATAPNALTVISLFTVAGVWYGAPTSAGSGNVSLDPSGHLPAEIQHNAVFQQLRARRPDAAAETFARIEGHGAIAANAQIPFGSFMTLPKGVAISGLRMWNSSPNDATMIGHMWGGLIEIGTNNVIKKTTDDVSGLWPAFSAKIMMFETPFTPTTDLDVWTFCVQVAKVSTVTAMAAQIAASGGANPLFHFSTPATSWVAAKDTNYVGPETCPAQIVPIAGQGGPVYFEAIKA